jgi:ATP-dependent DNA helicase RecQ
MDHFQVSAGIGAGQRFPFEVDSFAESFGWNAAQVSYAIKTMEQCGYFFLSEGYLRPSTLVFTTDRYSLAELEKQEPRTEPLIKALLRSYEGIFDYPASIRETWLAKQTSTPIGMLRDQLKWLHQNGIIRYRPAAENPEMVLLLNRMYRDDFRIDKQGINLRKQENWERIQAMVRYAQNEKTCRSVFIGTYFEDLTIAYCGNCVVCEQ